MLCQVGAGWLERMGAEGGAGKGHCSRCDFVCSLPKICGACCSEEEAGMERHSPEA